MNGDALPNFTKPNLGEYRITPPSARSVNDYVNKASAYDVNHGNTFTECPTLTVKINGTSENVGVYPAGAHLLCVYAIPWDGKEGTKAHRLYFVLSCADNSRGKGAPTWSLQSSQLVSVDDGDKQLLKVHGPAAIISRIMNT